MHAAMRHGTPNLTFRPKDVEASFELRTPRSPIRSFNFSHSPRKGGATYYTVPSLIQVCMVGLHLAFETCFSQSSKWLLINSTAKAKQ